MKGGLSKYYPLFAILIGVLLISLPMGPYETLDTELEYNTTRGVLRWGYPYLDRFGEPSTESYGDLFNVPPLGFYTQALFFQVLGAHIENGVFLITLFGLGSAIIVYKLGKIFYGKSTGIFAAAFFVLSPWELILSRAFLIDVQCLFLSLVYFYFGILAIQKNSIRLTVISGIFFAAAFLTKQYAVFMLIPLLLIYVYNRPKKLKHIFCQLSAFSLPFVFSSLLWYNVIMKKELFYLIQHNDFRDLNFPEIVPKYSFLSNFLIDYGLGFLFFIAVVFSLVIGFLFWRYFSKQVIFSDLICLITLLSILFLELYLAINLNLKAPYTSAIKYSYHSLPFFSLIAGSLALKSASLLKSAKNSLKLNKALLFFVGSLGLFFLVVPILVNMNSGIELATKSYVIFRVQPELDVGYSFFVDLPLVQGEPLQFVQFFGVLIILSGLLWIGRKPFMNLLRPLRQLEELEKVRGTLGRYYRYLRRI